MSGSPDVIDQIAARHKEHTTWRHDLHAHPETAFSEVRTAAFVAERLRSFGIEPTTGIATTGVVGTLQNGSGPAIALRADMDALDVSEKNDFAHRSTVPGKMHACGHDGHTTILLAAAEHLASTKNFKGTVHFIFQPAEENEGGARVMVHEGLFERFPADAVFALHNWPGVPVGKFGVRPGPIMAAFDIFEITVKGQGCHAAMPHMGVDPIVATGQLVSALQTVRSREVNPLDGAVLSVTQFHAGDAYNVIPSSAVIRGTVRCFSEAVQSQMEQAIERISQGVAAATGTECKVHYERRYPPTVNSLKETEFARSVAAQIVGSQNIISDMQPSMGSEDFSFMLKERQGCYVRLGNGSAEGGCMLHSPHYDFNDALIPIGATYFVRLAERFCAEP